MTTVVNDPVAKVSTASPEDMVRGVYGIRLEGLGDMSLLTDVDAGAPRLDVSFEFGRVADRVEALSEDSAEIALLE